MHWHLTGHRNCLIRTISTSAWSELTMAIQSPPIYIVSINKTPERAKALVAILIDVRTDRPATRSMTNRMAKASRVSKSTITWSTRQTQTVSTSSLQLTEAYETM